MKRQRREGGITQRGEGTFQIRYEIPNPGGPRKTMRETVKAANRGEAQKILNTKLAARDNGSWVEPNKTTLVEFITETIARGNYTPTIRDRYDEILEVHIAPYFGAVDPAATDPAKLQQRLARITPDLKAVRLQDLTPRQIDNWQAALALHTYRGRPIGPATRHQIDKVLRLALRRAVKLQLLTRSPAADIKRPVVPRQEMAILTPAQFHDLLTRLATDPRPEAHCMGALAAAAAHSGARLGELIGLRWSDLDLAAGIWRLQRSIRQYRNELLVMPCKTERSRRVLRLGPVAISALQRHKREQAERLLAAGHRVGPDDPVFDNGAGGMLPPHRITDRWWKMLRQIGFAPALSFHKLRHLHASLAIGAGVDILTVSRRLGHANVKITLDVYGHLLPGADGAAADAVEAALGPLG
jgi:integrase